MTLYRNFNHWASLGDSSWNPTGSLDLWVEEKFPRLQSKYKMSVLCLHIHSLSVAFQPFYIPGRFQSEHSGLLRVISLHKVCGISRFWVFVCVSFTCILSKLVHRLQINDVGRELAVHLPQHHAAPGVPLQHVLDMVANRCAVRPPTAVLVQPLPDYHPGHVLRGVPQPVDGHQQPRSRTSHQSADRLGTSSKNRKVLFKKKLGSATGRAVPPQRGRLSHGKLCGSHCLQVTGCRSSDRAVEKVSRRPVPPVRRGGRCRRGFWRSGSAAGDQEIPSEQKR